VVAPAAIHVAVLSRYDTRVRFDARAVAVRPLIVAAPLVLLWLSDWVTVDVLPAIAGPLVAAPPLAVTLPPAPPAPPVPPVTGPEVALPPRAFPLSVAPMLLAELPLSRPMLVTSAEFPLDAAAVPPQPAHEVPPAPPAPPAALPPVAVLPPAAPPVAAPVVLLPLVAGPLVAMPVELVAVFVPPAAEPVVRVDVAPPVVEAPVLLAFPLVGSLPLLPPVAAVALPPFAPDALPVGPPLPVVVLPAALVDVLAASPLLLAPELSDAARLSELASAEPPSDSPLALEPPEPVSPAAEPVFVAPWLEASPLDGSLVPTLEPDDVWSPRQPEQPPSADCCELASPDVLPPLAADPVELSPVSALPPVLPPLAATVSPPSPPFEADEWLSLPPLASAVPPLPTAAPDDEVDELPLDDDTQPLAAPAFVPLQVPEEPPTAAETGITTVGALPPLPPLPAVLYEPPLEMAGPLYAFAV
jgi:hypothetical protein